MRIMIEEYCLKILELIHNRILSGFQNEDGTVGFFPVDWELCGIDKFNFEVILHRLKYEGFLDDVRYVDQSDVIDAPDGQQGPLSGFDWYQGNPGIVTVQISGDFFDKFKEVEKILKNKILKQNYFSNINLELKYLKFDAKKRAFYYKGEVLVQVARRNMRSREIVVCENIFREGRSVGEYITFVDIADGEEKAKSDVRFEDSLVGAAKEVNKKFKNITGKDIFEISGSEKIRVKVEDFQ